MKKILTAGMAALTLGASTVGMATPAAAQQHRGGNWSHGGSSYHGGYGYRGGYGYHGGYYRRGDSTGAAIAGGIVGLALGAAISSSNHPHYYRSGPYYGGAYYDGYYDGGYYDNCVSYRRIWDPYLGAYIRQRYVYPC